MRAGLGRGVVRRGVSVVRSATSVVLVSLIVGAGLYLAYGTQNECTGQGSNLPTPSFSGSVIKIGYLTELGGSAASDGYSARIGAELAVNATNANGGVDGKTIQLLDLDTRTVPSVACQQAAVADRSGVLAITGPTDANDAAVIGQYSEANGVPFIASNLASATLNSPNLKWTTAVEPDAVQQGAAIAKYISEVVPSARIALLTQSAIEQTEMASGARWFADTYKNETVVYDQVYSSSQFPWGTAGESAKIAGANAVIVSWLPTVGFSESNVVQALLSVGFRQSQIFFASLTPNVTDLGTEATGMRGALLFDQETVSGYPNASSFVSEVRPYITGQPSPPIPECAPCLDEVGGDYYFGYLGMELIIAAIQNATHGGQTLTRSDFMSSLRESSVPDLMGGTLGPDGSSSTQGKYQVVSVGPLNKDGVTYGLTTLERSGFPQGVVPVQSLAG